MKNSGDEKENYSGASTIYKLCFNLKQTLKHNLELAKKKSNNKPKNLKLANDYNNKAKDLLAFISIVDCLCTTVNDTKLLTKEAKILADYVLKINSVSDIEDSNKSSYN